MTIFFGMKHTKCKEPASGTCKYLTSIKSTKPKHDVRQFTLNNFQVINLYLKVILSKVMASDRDKSSYDFVPCTSFQKICHPVGVKAMGTVKVYLAIHGYGNHVNETKYINVPLFNNNYWHLLIISIEDQTFTHCCTRKRRPSHAVEYRRVACVHIIM